MYVCTPLFVPSNLGETKLFLTISPSFEDIPDSSNLWEDHKGYDETYRFEGYVCYIWAATAKLAQRKTADFSKELERKPTYPIQSDRLYFLPLFDNVSYALSVTPQKHHERPVIRVPTTPTTRNGPGTVKSTLLTLSSYKRPFSPMSGTCLKSGCRYWTSRGQRHEGKNRSSQQHRPHRPRANPAAHKAPDWSNFPQSLQTGL